ncbi:hypothetical protein ACFOD9_03055 [Novosphingobium bradum]|uniref:Glycosyltransferase RgtA/B/C/D-like domain-containing protein n=1 Tax=Novosphingobium bradum TaxID=1737444 RepID=A0ABV7IQU7_9SPHN
MAASTTSTSAPSATRIIRAAVAVLVLALAGALAWAMAARGPWYDEFFTLYVTSRPETFTEALGRHWLADNHPPLFYALADLADLAGWLGPAVEQRRLVNALIGLAALGGGWAVTRGARTEFRLLAAFYLAALVAQPTVLVHGAELRSYFLSLAACAVLVLALVRFYAEPRPGASRLALWLAMVVAFNTHIATSLIAGALVAAFLAVALARRRGDFVRAVLPPALVGGALFVAVTAVQWPHWEANTRAFWIAPGLFAARWGIEVFVLAALRANLIVLAGGALGLGLLGWRALRREISPRADCVLALVLGTGFALAMIVAIHLVLRPFVVDRYLVGLVPALAMVLALGVAALAGRWPRLGLALLLAATAASLLALWANARETAARPSWNGTAALIAAEIRRCPATVVHHDAMWNEPVAALAPAENRQVLPFAYALMAARHGFMLEPAASRRVAKGCPTLFWTEHGQAPGEAALLARLKATGYPLGAVAIRRVGDGWVGVARP